VQRDLMRFALKYSPVHGGNRWEEAREWVNAHFMISTFPEDEIPTSQILFEEMDAAALLYNCQNFVTDPFNEIIDDLGRESETSYIGRFLANMKARGRKNNLSNIVVAHPTKAGGEPNLYAISGSAHWKNKADIGAIVSRISRDDGTLTNMSKITIEKTKDHETMGAPGHVIVTFNRDICDFELGDTSVYIPQEHDDVENIGHYTD
jgi:twinkle protein